MAKSFLASVKIAAVAAVVGCSGQQPADASADYADFLIRWNRYSYDVRYNSYAMRRADYGSDPRLSYSLAIEALQYQKISSAKKFLTALGTQPHEQRLRAFGAMLARDYAEAASIYESILQSHPDYWIAEVELASLGIWTEQPGTLEKLTQLSTNLNEPYADEWLAMAVDELGDPQLALDLYQKLIEQAPPPLFSDVYYRYGTLLIRARDRAKGCAMLREGQRRSGILPENQLELAPGAPCMVRDLSPLRTNLYLPKPPGISQGI